MTTTNTYLTFNGNCEEAFDFYKSVFGGEFEFKGKFSDMPSSEDYTMPEEDNDKIMHISLKIGTSILLGSDCGTSWAPQFKAGNNFSISVSANSKLESERIFEALSHNGEVTMPLQSTFWSESYGMLTDQFGINWMVGYSAQPM